MEHKKNPNSDIRRKSSLFMSIGLMLSMLLVNTAFEWKSYNSGYLLDFGDLESAFEPIPDISVTVIPPPPPPPIPPPEIIEVPDDKKIEKTILPLMDTETTPEDKIADLVFKDPPLDDEPEKVHIIVEEQPTPVGGIKAFYTYVRENLKYPSQARRMLVEGKVYVTFIVDTDGSITEVKVLKGIGAGCDLEAARVVSGAPKWNPGKQRGRAVKVRMQLPIYFRLD